jgi:hypothetical protein
MRCFRLALPLLILATSVSAQQAEDAMLGEIMRLRGRVTFLEDQLQKREEQVASMGKDLKSLADAIGEAKDRLGPASLGPAFLQAPPTPSDTVGVAKLGVLQPRFEVDSALRHDLVTLKLKRIDAGGVHLVADLEIGSDVLGTDLPLDQNGALYVLDWSTGEGFNYSLVLRDGATGKSAAQVQIKQNQSQGRMLFVGYKLD